MTGSNPGADNQTIKRAVCQLSRQFHRGERQGDKKIKAIYQQSNVSDGRTHNQPLEVFSD
ncbi:MAG: hypothetical protein ACE5FD_05545 [Anaerolineae bacterium]